MGSHAIHENLDTAFVNLAALLRFLQDRDFVGRVHVDLVECDADVYLNRSESPRVRATDLGTAETTEGESTLQQLIDRSREAGGLISIYEGDEETTLEVKLEGVANSPNDENEESGTIKTSEEIEREEMVRLSGELIAAVERAVLANGGDFMANFHAARIELADDYSFLDPTSQAFEYISAGHVHLRATPTANTYAKGISECLRRVVARLATNERRIRVRMRVALELAVLARRRQSELERFKFTRQFDRISGVSDLVAETRP